MLTRFLSRMVRKRAADEGAEALSAAVNRLLPLLRQVAEAFARREASDLALQAHGLYRALHMQSGEAVPGSDPSDPIARSPRLGDGEGELPRRLGRYDILHPIGRGAVGTVYLAKDPRIHRSIAVKVMRFSQSMDADELKAMKVRFFLEAVSAGTLSHPNIVTIYDADEIGGVAYIAMEHLDGVPLKAFTDKRRLLAPLPVVNIGIRVAEALDHAHGRGVVHRDVKPANIMVLRNGGLKLTDFGMARPGPGSKGQTTGARGTPFYMSPEQFAGAGIDGRSDIFSLGVTLFQLLTGEMPFMADSAPALMKAVTEQRHADPLDFAPHLPEALVLLLSRCLEKQPGRRYPTAMEVVKDLRAVQRHLRGSPWGPAGGGHPQRC